MKKLLLKLIPKSFLRDLFVMSYDKDLGKRVSVNLRNSFLKDMDADKFCEGLNELLNLDKQNYFNSPKENQETIKGGYYRTLYLLSLRKKMIDEDGESKAIKERIKLSNMEIE